MFGLERLQAIRELIIEKKSVEVTSLSKELNVSEVTIRRDLDKLEKEGLVIKTYGGAILVEDMVTPTYSEDNRYATEGKNFEATSIGVARTAVKLIADGDTIFIDGSHIGHALVRELKELQNLIIVTNNIEIAIYLFRETTHKVVMLGGEINSETGDVMEFDQLDELFIEKVFISVDGIDLQVGYTVNDKNTLRLFKKLKAVARELVIMVDHTVFEKRGLIKMTSLNEIKTIVTDKHFPDRYKEYYYGHNVKVHTTMLG